MLVRAYRACSLWSRDTCTIKSLRVAQFRYTAKAAFVARERVFVHPGTIHYLLDGLEKLHHYFRENFTITVLGRHDIQYGHLVLL